MRGHSYDRVKRALDAVGAAIALVVLSPLLIATAVVVGLALGRPVIFAQTRPGLNGRLFVLYKFRTMRPIDPVRGWTTNEQRMTRFGRFLRATSIDELPSLWNILRGEMSFVGPRPLRVSYLERYSAEQRDRHDVRPGLTGLAQVRGRNAVGWDQRINLDLAYARTRSLQLDARILLLTVKAVLLQRGVSADGQATMSEFFGPEETSRLKLVSLDVRHLPLRVEWLSDERVRRGISIAFSPDLASTETWFHGVRTQNGRMDWVGTESSGRPVSMCGIRWESREVATLYIYVDPDQHGRGYGSDTMTLLIARARQLGIESLRLETPEENAIARRMYERLGFGVVADTKIEGKVLMTKSIRSGHRDA